MTQNQSAYYSTNGNANLDSWGSVPTDNNSTWNAATCNWSPTEAEWEYASRGGTIT